MIDKEDAQSDPTRIDFVQVLLQSGSNMEDPASMALPGPPAPPVSRQAPTLSTTASQLEPQPQQYITHPATTSSISSHHSSLHIMTQAAPPVQAISSGADARGASTSHVGSNVVVSGTGNGGNTVIAADVRDNSGGLRGNSSGNMVGHNVTVGDNSGVILSNSGAVISSGMISLAPGFSHSVYMMDSTHCMDGSIGNSVYQQHTAQH